MPTTSAKHPKKQPASQCYAAILVAVTPFSFERGGYFS
jgi:hypothetical protein